MGVPHFAKRTARQLSRLGVAVVRVSDHWHFGLQRTRILYREGQLGRAEALRAALPVQARLVPARTLADGVDVRLILGRDLAAGSVAFLQADEATFARATPEPADIPDWRAPSAVSIDRLGASMNAASPGWRHS